MTHSSFSFLVLLYCIYLLNLRLFLLLFISHTALVEKELAYHPLLVFILLSSIYLLTLFFLFLFISHTLLTIFTLSLHIIYLSSGRLTFFSLEHLLTGLNERSDEMVTLPVKPVHLAHVVFCRDAEAPGKVKQKEE